MVALLSVKRSICSSKSGLIWAEGTFRLIVDEEIEVLLASVSFLDLLFLSAALFLTGKTKMLLLVTVLVLPDLSGAMKEEKEPEPVTELLLIRPLRLCRSSKLLVLAVALLPVLLARVCCFVPRFTL